MYKWQKGMKQSLCSIWQFVQENKVYGFLQAKTAIYMIESDVIEAQLTPRRGQANCTNEHSVVLLPLAWNDLDSATCVGWYCHFLGKVRCPKECKEIGLRSGPTQSSWASSYQASFWSQGKPFFHMSSSLDSSVNMTTCIACLLAFRLTTLESQREMCLAIWRSAVGFS